MFFDTRMDPLRHRRGTVCNAPGGLENKSEKWTYFWSRKMIRKNWNPRQSLPRLACPCEALPSLAKLCESLPTLAKPCPFCCSPCSSCCSSAAPLLLLVLLLCCPRLHLLLLISCSLSVAAPMLHPEFLPNFCCTDLQNLARICIGA